MPSAIDNLIHLVHRYDSNPLLLLVVFVVANLFMIWRLQRMERKGFEGTVLGTLIMPYCSGFANLVFAYVMSSSANNGPLVLENCLVNNVSNLTLILGMSAVFGSASAIKKGNARQGAKKNAEFHRINRLNLIFTLIALFLFTGSLWALASDRKLDFYDGLVLVGLFLFWQILHVFEILKDNIRKNKTFHWTILLDLAFIAASAYCIYFSVDHLVAWVSTADNTFFKFSKIGWLSGMFMVLPNAFIAMYYSRIGRQDIVLSSQIGDSHICIPMCIGLFSVFNTIHVPLVSFQTGIFIIMGAGLIHMLSIILLGRIPRFAGLGLIGGYVYFVYKGLIH